MFQKIFLSTLIFLFVLMAGIGFTADVYKYYAPASYNLNSAYDEYPKPILCVYKYDDTESEANAPQMIRYYYDTTTSANVKIDQGDADMDIRSLTVCCEGMLSLIPIQDADSTLTQWFEDNWVE